MLTYTPIHPVKTGQPRFESANIQSATFIVYERTTNIESSVSSSKMKSIFATILFALLLSTSSCLLKNFTHYGNRSETYDFETDSTFRWYGFGGNGAGTYKIINDSIKLLFREFKKKYVVISNEKTPNSSINSNIEVRATHSNGQPFEGLIIGIVDPGINLKTDKNGIVKINIPDARSNDIINAHIDGSSVYAVWDIKLRGYDHVISIIVSGDNEHKSDYLVTFHYRKKGKAVYLNGTEYRKYIPMM